MHRKHIQKKGLALLIIILFIGMTAIPIAGDIIPEKTKPERVNADPACEPHLLGQFGKNLWYISCVRIYFTWDDELVEEIQYSITLDPTKPEWITYKSLFEFCDDGDWTFQYQWLNKIEGNWTFGGEIPIQIDQTPPTVTLTKKVNSIQKKMTFTAHPQDDASSIERVEFYLDNNLQENLTKEPWEYIYTWTGKYPGYHWVKAIVYDFAGHSSEKSTQPVSHPTYPPILGRILYRIQNLYELFFQLR